MGVAGLYREIFRLIPQTEFIVDSSKPPVWIMDQTLRAKAQRIELANVVIWKTPDEFFASRVRRGEERGWSDAWINYYLMYFGSVSDWISVRYSDLVNDKTVLPKLCEALGIRYFPEKHEYWRKTHHTLFGNDSAKIHLYGESSSQFARLSGELRQTDRQKSHGANEHQRVYYRPPEAPPEVSPAERTQFELIQDVLDISDITKYGSSSASTALQRARALIGPVHARFKRYTYRVKRSAASAGVRLLPSGAF